MTTPVRSYPNRDDVYALLERVTLGAGCKKCVRYYYEPRKDGEVEKLPIAAVVFDQPEEIKRNPDGSRWHSGSLLLLLWADELPGDAGGRSRSFAKLDELKRNILDLLALELPQGNHSSTQLGFGDARYHEFYGLEEGPVGGALEMDYNYAMTPKGPGAPKAINLLTS